ncbi:HicB family toxin-antitoxin system [Mycobacterium sp. SM1]|uniref:type II toxin-antitoxin system HicB family antitoxin n=1 Tax=Mycobacterium sp. SM1 TaxID=2816243 RepID=UPI001BCD95F0|nr:HicB family toxin-antitoxin system [Mycobacterium sp. SM1]MBS4730539.1 HicB family toxin-antitoxin system [Mycobacterium sp. SM1]
MKTYHAVATRGDRFWLVHIPEIDQWTQARTLSEIELMARDLIAVWLQAPLDSFDVAVDIQLPAQVRQHLDEAARRRGEAARAQSMAACEYRAAAKELKTLGLTVRDIGKVLNISYQRAQQLLTSGAAGSQPKPTARGGSEASAATARA